MSDHIRDEIRTKLSRMIKLKAKQTYFNRCEYGQHLIKYLIRDKNVNTSITDEDMFQLANSNLGNAKGGWCETCNKKTLQTCVAYSLERAS